MTTSNLPIGMSVRQFRFFQALFLISALWNFAGAFPGLLDSAGMFEREFGQELNNPVLIAIYRGAWGTAFLYGIGFLLVAYNPIRHTGVVAMGGLGKALFAINLLIMYLNGWTSDFAIIVIGGDVVFVLLFAFYFLRLKQCGQTLF